MPDTPNPVAHMSPTMLRGYNRTVDLQLQRRQAVAAARSGSNITRPRAIPPINSFLLVPAFPNDNGARPLKPGVAYHNGSVQIVPADSKPGAPPVVSVEAGKNYRVRCVVSNRGQAPVLLGIAEFILTKQSAQMPGAPAKGAYKSMGLAGFTLRPGASTTLTCPRVWTPSAAEAAGSSVIVCAYDMLTDAPTARYDAVGDRHNGRLDVSPVPDFTSDWYGAGTGVFGKEGEVKARLVQTGSAITATIQTATAAPLKAAGKVTGSTAILTGSGVLAFPTASTQTWTATFNPDGTLSITVQDKSSKGVVETGDTFPLVRVG